MRREYDLRCRRVGCLSFQIEEAAGGPLRYPNTLRTIQKCENGTVAIHVNRNCGPSGRRWLVQIDGKSRTSTDTYCIRRNRAISNIHGSIQIQPIVAVRVNIFSFKPETPRSTFPGEWLLALGLTERETRRAALSELGTSDYGHSAKANLQNRKFMELFFFPRGLQPLGFYQISEEDKPTTDSQSRPAGVKVLTSRCDIKNPMAVWRICECYVEIVTRIIKSLNQTYRSDCDEYDSTPTSFPDFRYFHNFQFFLPETLNRWTRPYCGFLSLESFSKTRSSLRNSTLL